MVKEKGVFLFLMKKSGRMTWVQSTSLSPDVSDMGQHPGIVMGAKEWQRVGTLISMINKSFLLALCKDPINL